MSIIIIAFPACPTVDPAAVKHENELNALLEKKVTGEDNNYYINDFEDLIVQISYRTDRKSRQRRGIILCPSVSSR